MTIKYDVKKSITVGLLLFLLLAVPVTGYLLYQNQNPHTKASSGSGTATVSLSPQTANLNVGDTQQVKIYFNTHDQSVGVVQTSITYSFSGGTPEIIASNLQLDSAFNASGDWLCQLFPITTSNSLVHVDLSCEHGGGAGFTSSSDVLIATFDLKVNSIPASNPTTVKFDEPNTHIYLYEPGNNNPTDVAQTPSSQLDITVGGGSNTTTAQTHNICINNSCVQVSGTGTSNCSNAGGSCTQTFSQQAATACGGTYDPNCYDCNGDGLINILDFSCLRNAFGMKKASTGVNWQ